MMVIPLHDDCYFSDVDVDSYVLSHSLPTGGRFGIFWNNWPFVNLVDRAVSQPVCLNTVKHRFFPLFFHLFNEQKSMSSESLGLQSIFISPKIAEQISRESRIPNFCCRYIANIVFSFFFFSIVNYQVITNGYWAIKTSLIWTRPRLGWSK